MKQTPARLALVLLFIFIGCFGVAYAAAGMLTALPAPAIGGTCGPSTASETALEALARPGSIGAGPEPPASNATAHHQWQTFIQQCQSLADRRGLASLAVLVLSLAVAATGLIWVLRQRRKDDDTDETVDGSTEWPGGPGGPSELVGASAVMAPPAYGMAPYPSQQPAWPAQPPTAYPYAAAPTYPAAPPFPEQPAYPPAPYPSAPPYPPAPEPYPPAPAPYPAAPPPPPPPPPPAPPVAPLDTVEPVDPPQASPGGPTPS